MSATRSRRKRGGAKVTVLATGSRRVDLTWEGKRYRKVFPNALAMCHTINASIARGEDPTPYFDLATKSATKSKTELFQQWIEFKARLGAKPNTITSYETVLRTLDECPWELKDGRKIRNWLITNKPPESARKALIYLGACCKWAGEENPYSKWASDIPRTNPEPVCIEDWDIHSLTLPAGIEDRMLVCIEFLFLTGCRASEALGLRYMDLIPSQDLIIFRGQWDGDQWTPGLKTQSHREFPVYGPLGDLVTKLVTKHNGDADARVFPYDIKRLRHAFRKTFPDYNLKDTRSTFITEQVAKGVNPEIIAEWCGNSAEVIRKHYLSRKTITKGQLPR